MTDPGHGWRVIIVAPVGRDALLASEILERAGIQNCVRSTVDELCDDIEAHGAAGAMLADEVLVPRAVSRIGAMLAAQGSWSDLPIIVFANGARVETATRFEALGNVTILDRPMRMLTLVSAAKALLRVRRRQYEMRADLETKARDVRQRDEFLAMLGHELRNPLSAIHLGLELIQPADEESRKHRVAVRRQANNLSRLVDDLLDVARVTSGKVVLQLDMLELGALVDRCVTAHEGLIRARQLRVGQRIAPAVTVCGDAVRLEQVVTNLLVNAIKYTRSGGNLDVVLAAEDDHAVLSICDDGVGISSEMLPRIFNLFEQVEGTIDRSKGGMGIGLTLVRSLVELHGGAVEASSGGLGQGSEFRVLLPRQRTIPPPPAAPRDVERHEPRAHHQLLVVEDNADNRELLCALLERSGHEVLTAEDGQHALELISGTKIEVMIVDIGLPGMDGYEVARRVRAMRGSSVYLIALTGYGQPEDQRRAEEAGFDIHLTKPVDFVRLERLCAETSSHARA